MSEDANAAKKRRLAEALRANLKRRKAAAGRSSVDLGATRPEPLGDQNPGQDSPGHDNKG